MDCQRKDMERREKKTSQMQQKFGKRSAHSDDSLLNTWAIE